MNRIERLSAILIHLQSKRVVTAGELARRFGVGIRTVYRDIRALEEAGIPVGSEAGLGYYLAEGYHLRPVALTIEEAFALLTAGKLAAQLTDAGVRAHVESALYKIKAVLKDGEKEHLQNLEDKMAVYGDHSEKPPGFLTEIQTALSEKKVLRLEYSSYNQKSTAREIEPVSLGYYEYRWHLLAWCRLRNDYRDFRTDRITGLTVTEENFDDKRHPPLQAILQEQFAGKNLRTAVLRFNKRSPYGIIKKKCAIGFIEEKDLGDHVEMTLLIDSLEVLAAWLHQYTPDAEIHAPEELKKLFHEVVPKASP